MTNNQLEIILKLRDEVSKHVERMAQEIKNDLDGIGDSFVKVGNQISKMGRNLAMIGASITGPLALAFKTTADCSLEANAALTKLQDSFTSFQVTIGTALIPVIDKISNAVAGLAQWFSNLDPKVRDTIIQVALVSGIFLTLGGALTHVIGKIIATVGAIMQFGAAHPYILAITAALVIMIKYWDQLRNVAIPVLNGIEIGLRIVATGFYNLVSFMAGSIEKVLNILQAIFGWLGKVSEKIGREFSDDMKNAAKSIGNVKEDLDILRTSFDATANEMAEGAVKIAEGGTGAISSFVDESITNINKLGEALNGIKDVDIGSEERIQKIVVEEQRKVDGLRDIWRAWNDEKATMEMGRLQAETEFFNLAIDTQKKAHESLWVSIGKMRDAFSQDVSKLFVDMMRGVANVKQVFQELGWKMIQILVDFAVQKVVNWALGNAMLVAQVAASSAAAAAVAAAWAPAAAMVSLASFGSNAAPASAALLETAGLAQILAIPRFEKGGNVISPGLTLVGERGPEILNLPAGARVSPLNKQGNITHIHIEINNPSVRSDTDIDAITEAVSTKLSREIERI
ncbi:MAG: hypothetical protein WCI77_08075 [Candidatus Omnitrophota bacterium]